MEIKKILFLVMLSLLITACTLTERAPETPLKSLPDAVEGTLYVDPGIEMGPISPLIYGSNFGPWTAVPFMLTWPPQYWSIRLPCRWRWVPAERRTRT